MIKSITIKSFRGIREGTLEDLTPLVILVGPNGSGKSSILDALMIGGGNPPAMALQKVLGRRESPIPRDVETAKPWLFHKGKRAIASIELMTSSSLVRTTILGTPVNNPLQVVENFRYRIQGDPIPELQAKLQQASQNPQVFVASPDISEMRFLEPTAADHKPLHELYTKAYREGLSRQAKSLILDLIPGAEDIVILTEGNNPIVHIAYPDFSLPVAMAGDGIRLLIQQSFELAGPEGCVILLEEPEAHLHPGAIRNSAKAVVAAIQRKQQIVLTTHSLEYIDAILDAASDADLPNVSLYRIALENGVLKVARLSGQEIALARQAIQDDLR